MDLDKLLIAPQTIAFATTYQCNASCKNCCFGCSPQMKVRLSIEDMKFYIDQALKFYSDSLKVLVLTGGESFLLKDDLIEIVKYGSSKGLVTRIVTNAFWAKDYQTAYDILLNLRENGLNEINYNTGDDHQEWVPYDNIVTACIAAMDLNLTCIVNVETHDNAIFDGNTFFQDSRLSTYFDYTKYEKPLKIEKGLWIPFNSDSHITSETIVPKEDVSKTRCHSLFTTIAINPFSYMMSCCGLVSEHILPLRLGSLKKHSIKELYELQFIDLLKIWLYTEGPYNVLKYVYEKRGIHKKISGHICAICAEIFRDTENIQCIKDNYEELFDTVMFKYLLLRKTF